MLNNSDTKCKVLTKDKFGNDTECGRPPFTNNRELCEIHYSARFPVTAQRLIENKPEPDPFDVFRENNKTHSIPQMIHAFGNIYKMRKALGGENLLEYWFKHNYGQNPLCEQALEQIRLMKWQAETGVNAVSDAFAELGF